MQSVNLIVHIVSGLVVVALVWAILRQQKQLQFHKRLWDTRISDKNSVFLGWPRPFFESLAEVWGVQVDGVIDGDQPLKITLEAWVLCHVELGILRIESLAERHLCVWVKRPDVRGDWADRLMQALSHRFRIELKVSSQSTASV